MKDEYDFSNARPNKYAQKYAEGTNIVALDSDLVEQCRRKIDEAVEHISGYRKKYDCQYDAFQQAIQTDKDFLAKVEKQNQLWEEDAIEWAYWVEEQKTWQGRLVAILNR